MLFLIAFLIFVAYLAVKNNSCGKSCSLKFLVPILKVMSSLFFPADFNPFTC